MTAPSFEDLYLAAKQEALARPTRLTPEIFETDGSDVQIAIAAGAAMAERVGAYSQGELNGLRLRTVGSVGDAAVEQLAASEYHEFKRGALQAIVPLLWRRSPSQASTSVPAGTLVGTTGGVTFRTATDLLFQPGQIGPLSVVGIATTAGPGGNVPADSITKILSPLEDTTLAVSNDEPAAGGRVAETNEELIAKCETAYQRARKGTIEAIQGGAEIVDGVASARVYEQLDGDAVTGRVVVQILGAGRTSNAALRDRVKEKLRSVRAAGVPAIVSTLSARMVPIEAYSLIVMPGYDAAQVLGAARRALVALVEGLQVGATLYRSQILATLTSIEGLIVPDSSLTTPAADVEPANGEYLDTTLDLVVLSISAAP